MKLNIGHRSQTISKMKNAKRHKSTKTLTGIFSCARHLVPYVPGANITLPRPCQSQFFKVSDAGFLILKNKDAAYYIRGNLSEGRVKPYFVRVEYDNPQDESQPFENEADLTPDKNYAVFTSPDAVWGIHYWKTYTIRVSIFDNRESKQPIDTIVQPLRSYVDTTSGEVRIDNHLTTEPLSTTTSP